MGGLLSKHEFLRQVRSMDPYRFEHFVADVWEERGFETTVRRGSGDRGIDVVATKGSEKQLIQAKRYAQSNKIGSQAVRNYATLYQQVDDADSVVIVTTSSFTEEGRTLAEDLDVETIDATQFFDIVNTYAPGAAVEYLAPDAPASTGMGNQESDSPDVGALSPFSDEEEFVEIKSDQDLLERCPECNGTDVWQGKVRKGVVFTLLKCEDCEAVWTTDNSWPDTVPEHDNWERLSHEDDLEKKEHSEPDPCFIATAAYGTPKAEEIDQLRDFRDEVLLENGIGKVFVACYYRFSPPIAEWVSRSERRKRVVRTVIIRPSLLVATALESSAGTRRRNSRPDP